MNDRKPQVIKLVLVRSSLLQQDLVRSCTYAAGEVIHVGFAESEW